VTNIRRENLEEREVILIGKFMKIVATFWKLPHPIGIQECCFVLYIGIIQAIGQCRNMETSRAIRKFLTMC